VSLETYSHLDPRRQAEFEELFQHRRKRTKHLLRLRELTDLAGVDSVVSRESMEWADRAIRALEPVPNGPYRHLLERLAYGAAERRF